MKLIYYKDYFSLFCFSAMNKVYACEVSRRDHLVRKEGGGYDMEEYQEFPERYASMFAVNVSLPVYQIFSSFHGSDTLLTPSMRGKI